MSANQRFSTFSKTKLNSSHSKISMFPVLHLTESRYEEVIISYLRITHLIHFLFPPHLPPPHLEMFDTLISLELTPQLSSSCLFQRLYQVINISHHFYELHQSVSRIVKAWNTLHLSFLVTNKKKHNDVGNEETDLKCRVKFVIQ